MLLTFFSLVGVFFMTLQCEDTQQGTPQEQPQQASQGEAEWGAGPPGQSAALRAERHLQAGQAVHSPIGRLLSPHQELLSEWVLVCLSVCLSVLFILSWFFFLSPPCLYFCLYFHSFSCFYFLICLFVFVAYVCVSVVFCLYEGCTKIIRPFSDKTNIWTVGVLCWGGVWDTNVHAWITHPHR